LKRNKKGSSLGVLLLLALFIGGALFVYTSAMFERDMPKLDLQTNGFWNLKEPLRLNIEDASGLKTYRVTLQTSNSEDTLEFEKLITPKKSVSLELEPPRSAYAIKDKQIKIIVEAQDASKWNFLSGNEIREEYMITIDKARPVLSILSNSYGIKKGGSALVVFKALDENMKSLYIETSFGKKFQAQPFYKEGYYISLLAWPVTEEHFKANIVVEDAAQNRSKSYVPLYLKDKHYRTSHIKISDNFLQGKIAELASEFAETQGVSDLLEQFKLINENVRAKNEKLIHEITSKVPDEMISDFKLHKMYPLKNAQVVASFGDHRKYSYKGSPLSESYHLGLDFASNAMASIKPKNSGKVVFADYNGLYGNMPIISHGLGLYTLYGHCSSMSVTQGEEVAAGQHIANTGKSGYAMGDHLHFGVLVQGVEVRPEEWMDDQWMQLNIYDIIQNAKSIIDRAR